MQEQTYENGIEVAFYLLGKNVIPSELTEVIGVRPCLSVNCGEERLHKRTGELIGHNLEGKWGFSSKEVVKSEDPSEHFSYIYSIIQSNWEYIASVACEAKPFIEVSLSGSKSCVLPRELVNMSQVIGLEFGFVSRCQNGKNT